ncbi:MAG: BACON domain-containing protein [Chloroflexota bacterium]
MKKASRSYYLVLALFLSVFIGCEDVKENPSAPTVVTSYLEFSQDSIVFYDFRQQELSFVAKNAANCEFQVISSPDWVTVYPDNGYMNRSIGRIIITPKVQGEGGIYEGSLIIMSTLKKSRDTIELYGYFNTQMADTLYFGPQENSKSFDLTNFSKNTVTYSLTAGNDLITLGSNSCSIASGGKQEIKVDVNRDKLIVGTNRSMIYVNDGKRTDTLQVIIEHYKESKTILSSNVVDAEYSKAKDLLVYVSSNPSSVNIYNNNAGTTEQIALNFTPTCVSLSLDGAYAVVGHDGRITYIDLNNRIVIKTYTISCDALDVVLGNNKWAYVFPREDQWARIICVDLNIMTDNEANNTGSSIYAGTLGRLHPSGKCIYGADNGLSPSDIERYDIQNGVAEFKYDSPYHGDYPMNGNLWFSEDGSRIFTRGKTVLSTSDSPSMDLKYNGKISLETGNYGSIQWLDHSAARGNLYIITSGADMWSQINASNILAYKENNLAFDRKYELEKFYVPQGTSGKMYDAIPYFVFANSSGDAIFVITKANGAGLAKEWAIQKIEVE